MNKGRIKARPFIRKDKMPIYDFKCLRPECGAVFELSMPISAIGTPKHDWPTCPECERIKTKRIIGAPALNFHPWRKKLADQPFEIDAIEQGVYEETYD